MTVRDFMKTFVEDNNVAQVAEKLYEDLTQAGIEVLFDIEIELDGIGGKRFFDLFLTVKGFGGVAGHVQRLGGKLTWLSGALDGEKHFVKKIMGAGKTVTVVNESDQYLTRIKERLPRYSLAVAGVSN